MEKARRHRRERRVVRFLVAVFGVALVAAGCGTSAPSTAEFSNQANGICHNYSAKLNHVISQLALPRHESREQLESELSDVLGLVQRGSVQLAALGRPDGEVGAIDKVLKAQSAQAKDLLRLVTGIKENDSTMTQSAEAALEESVAPLNQQLDILGMTTCGSGPLPASNGTK